MSGDAWLVRYDFVVTAGPRKGLRLPREEVLRPAELARLVTASQNRKTFKNAVGDTYRIENVVAVERTRSNPSRASDRITKLYRAALEADEAFTRELERVYGKRRAGDARYYYHHDDARVTAAANRKLKADEKLREAMLRPSGAPMENPRARRANPPPRGKPVAALTAAELERRIANMERRVSDYIGRLIEAGVGQLPHSELVRLRDEAPSSAAAKVIDGYLREWEILRPLLDERMRREQYHGSLKPIRRNPSSAPAAAAAKRGYVARYANGKTLSFRSSSDEAAKRYATGLGASRAGARAVSLKAAGGAGKKKAQIRRRGATSRAR